jgi:hypothetical protein
VKLDYQFDGIGLLSMENYTPFIFRRSWVLVILYLCFKFCIFDRPILEEYFFRLRGVHISFSHAFV